MVAQAFKPCAQLSRSSIRIHRGMGLGLAVVQRNVEALGAKIIVKSAPGQGSAFVVIIPVADPIAKAPPPDLRLNDRAEDARKPVQAPAEATTCLVSAHAIQS